MPFKKYPNIMDKYRQAVCERRVGDDYLMNQEYSLSPVQSSSKKSVHILNSVIVWLSAR